MGRRLLLTVLALLTLLPALQAEPDSLAKDGRVGLVTDRQGLVYVRPAGRQRWTPISARGLVLPGDRLRSESLGAHALEVRLKAGGRLTLGPGVLLDVRPDGALALLEGEIEVLGSEGAAVSVSGPGGFSAQVTAATWLQAKRGATTRLPEAPRWLTGYRGTATDEWMGSLLATIDGRQVPLHVGYHKVDAEIRDQVARTTVEQSFVNSTSARLEGVFRFPLPADASVSGFGMWIGSEYVEADVVERERARQIYEDILRRKKDPGLLEWAGGNVFQARVFPIEPHSEKRVRLRYTEVLPLEGSTWRYRYALRSELLQAHPLRELQITVRAASTVPLAEASCPTHPDATLTSDAETALVELSRRDFAPDRDFEVAVRVKGADGLTAVTHRRGPDGWFMLLLAPPDAAASAWQRDLVPEGAPLDLIVALDTSGSVAGRARSDADAFVRALLGLLGPQDRLRVCTFDAGLTWMAPAAKPADPDTVDEALRFVASRRAMGWTDLEGALDPLLEAAGAGTQVVLVTDGIATSGDGDVQALAQRIRARAGGTGAVVHAVAPAAAYEKPVLEALASLGGGSVRNLKDDPAGVAQRLLSEAAQPVLKDLRVEVEGVPTARIYPEVLPNLPLGAQQVVLGRFLPGGPASGTVVVRGTLEGKPVSFRAALSVPGDEQGNSFLPRLWARRHLDALLAQGATTAVKEEIVRFSTTYGIMTPYTSLLVLESDEDREQYGVARRVHARDGEVEFAAAGDQAALAAKRQAVKAAQGWRLSLRRALLTEIARLNRQQPVPVAAVALAEEPLWGDALAGWSAQDPRSGGWGAPEGPSAPASAPAPMGGAGGSFGGRRGEFKSEDDGYYESDSDARETLGELEKQLGDRSSSEDLEEAKEAAPKKPGSGEDALYDDLEAIEEELAEASKDKKAGESLRRSRRQPQRPATTGPTSPIAPRPLPEPSPGAWPLGFPEPGRRPYELEEAEARGERDWPPLPPVLADDALRTLLERVLRDGPGAPGAAGALRLATRRQVLHGPTQRVLAQAEHALLWSPQRWFLRSTAPLSEPVERALVDGQRSVLHAGRRLARTWSAGPVERWEADALRRALGYPTWRLLSGRSVVREPGAAGAEDLVLLRVATSERAPSELWTVSTARRLVLERRLVDRDGVVLRTVRYGDEVALGEAAGSLPWPRTVEAFDEAGRLVERRRIDVSALAPDALAAGVTQALSGRDDVLTLDGDLPTLSAARTALAAGRAGFAERLSLMLDRLSVERYDELWVHADAALALAAGKPGADWMRAALLARSRRGEALAALVRERLEAAALARADTAPALCMLVLATANQVLGVPEQLELLERLETDLTGRAAPAAEEVRNALTEHRIGLLSAAQRLTEARALDDARARSQPWNLGLQLRRLNELASQGDVGAALARIQELLRGRWTEAEAESLHARRSDLLLGQHDLDGLVPALTAWTQAAPRSALAEQRLLSVLLALGREPEAHARMDASLAVMPEPAAPLSREAQARAGAAVAVALGEGWFWRERTLHPRWPTPLVALARRALLGSGSRLALAQRVLGDARVRGTDPGTAALQDLRGALLGPDAAAWPLDRLLTAADLLRWRAQDADLPAWEALLRALTARLDAHPLRADREALVSAALRVAGARPEGRLRSLDVLRRLDALTSGPEREGTRQRLLEALLAVPYQPALEAEALGLLSALAREFPLPRARALGRHGLLLGRIVDWALAGRADLPLGTPEERAKRSREATRLAEREARKAARVALAAQLAAQLATGPAGTSAVPADALDPQTFTDLERAALLSDAGTDVPGALALAERVLALLPVTNEVLDPRDPATPVLSALEGRAAVLLSHAATRRGATPELVARAEALLLAREGSLRSDGRYEVFRFYVALDRLEALRARLAAWQAQPEHDPRWTRAAAYLEAELGRVEPAAALLRGLSGAEGALTATDQEALASWLLVLGDDPGRRAALRARYELENEWELRNRLQALMGQVSRRGPGVPGDLDPEALPMLSVLLAKSAYPANHFWVVQNLYQTTKDHRVLAALVEAVPGHTAQAVYPLLTQLAQLLGSVHEEAALDALREAGSARLKAEPAPAAQRALRLLLAAVEARAGEVLLKDPGPGERGAALLEAAAGPLGEGELRPMLGFLDAMPWSASGPLGAARVTLLERLLSRADVPSSDALAVAQVLARALWAGKRPDDALSRLESACAAAQASGDARALEALAPAYEQLASLLAEAGRFPAAETLLERERLRATTPAAREQLLLALFRIYGQGALKQGQLSFGRGDDLVRGAAQRMQAAWAAAAPLGSRIHALHIALFQAGQKAGLEAASGAARATFAREQLPGLLSRLPSAAAEQVNTEARALGTLAGPRPALRFLLDRAAAEPAFTRRIGTDVWDDNHWQMAKWRQEGEPLGELGAPLLAYVVERLSEGLRSDATPSSAFWQGTYAWTERFPEFLAAALGVAEEAPMSGARQEACGRLATTIGRHAEAADLLSAADGRKVLARSGVELLLYALTHAERWEPALAVVARLLAETPDVVGLHIERITILHRLTRLDEARAALASAAARFGERPGPTALSAWGDLGRTASLLGLHPEAVDLLTRSIEGRQALTQGRARGLAPLREWLARSLAALGRLEEAVDAAAAAIVELAGQRGGRSAFDGSQGGVLIEVLRGAPDLDGFARTFEERVARTKADVPLIRRALAHLYEHVHKRPERAIAQLEALRAVVADDPAVLDDLVRLYDAVGDAARGTERLEARLALDPGSADRWQALADRYGRAGAADLAERALTSAIEARPLEPDGHRLLARARFDQRRFPEAAQRWRRVTDVRPLEPEARVEEARAWIQASEPARAKAALDEVLAGAWEPRFAPVKEAAARLRSTLP